MNLDVYLFFNGNCREAMEFYKSIFGGELTVVTYADSPVPGMDETWLMHALLDGGDIRLMGSDTKNVSSEATKVSLSLGGNNESKMCQTFDKLVDGGKVFQPLAKAPWGDTFGSLTDKFGIEWMMNIASS